MYHNIMFTRRKVKVENPSLKPYRPVKLLADKAINQRLKARRETRTQLGSVKRDVKNVAAGETAIVVTPTAEKSKDPVRTHKKRVRPGLLNPQRYLKPVKGRKKLAYDLGQARIKSIKRGFETKKPAEEKVAKVALKKWKGKVARFSRRIVSKVEGGIDLTPEERGFVEYTTEVIQEQLFRQDSERRAREDDLLVRQQAVESMNRGFAREAKEYSRDRRKLREFDDTRDDPFSEFKTLAELEELAATRGTAKEEADYLQRSLKEKEEMLQSGVHRDGYSILCDHGERSDYYVEDEHSGWFELRSDECGACLSIEGDLSWKER